MTSLKLTDTGALTAFCSVDTCDEVCKDSWVNGDKTHASICFDTQSEEKWSYAKRFSQYLDSPQWQCVICILMICQVVQHNVKLSKLTLCLALGSTPPLKYWKNSTNNPHNNQQDSGPTITIIYLEICYERAHYTTQSTVDGKNTYTLERRSVLVK